MNRTLFLLSVLALSGCNDGPICSGLEGEVLPLADTPPGVALDVPYFAPTDASPLGDITAVVISGEIPGVAIEGLRLVGTPTTAGNYSVEVELTHADPGVCPTTASIYLEVRELECIDDQACDALTVGIDECVASSDCEPFGSAEMRCVQTVEAHGECVMATTDCRGELVVREYTDTEGDVFEGCGIPGGPPACEGPGYCGL